MPSATVKSYRRRTKSGKVITVRASQRQIAGGRKSSGFRKRPMRPRKRPRRATKQPAQGVVSGRKKG